MQGLHLTADLYDCQCAPHWLTDASALLPACERAAAAAGLTPVARLGHTFAATDLGAGGVTATVLLAESHVCVHTWPETGSVTLDVYVCNFSAPHGPHAEELMTRLIALFRPMRVHENALQRGTLPPTPAT
ncbi:MAG: S-adenosylmethionine decarboxylase [Burkholderiaceae bacterium]|jgi:S-adenosylmethionine decarboxylase